MSQEMAEKKRLEEEALAKEEEENREFEKTPCPHCLQTIGSFPYLATFPLYGWVECAACGIVFCPKPIRDKKIARAKSQIIT